MRSKLRSHDPEFWGLRIGGDALIISLAIWTTLLSLLSLQLFGLPVASLLTTNIGAVIVGLVLAPVFGATINAVAVKRGRLFELNDVVLDSKTGKKGIVEDISMIHTKFQTLDGESFSIPNYKLRSRDLIHYTRDSNIHRETFDVLVTYESEIPTAVSLLTETLEEQGEILDEPQTREQGLELSLTAEDDETFVQLGPGVKFDPTIHVESFGDSGILLRGRFWIREPCTVSRLKSELRRGTIEKFESEDVEFAYPHRQLLLDEENNQLDLSLDTSEEEVR
jgi:small-conductance mechanosensitive channel